MMLVAPPFACLMPIRWDPNFTPATNEELVESWAARGDNLQKAQAQLDCVSTWATSIQEASRTAPAVTGAPKTGPQPH